MKKRSLQWTVGLAAALLAPASSAQGVSQKPPAAATDALTDKARQLYEEGLTALKASRWADAHASFLAAWKLKEHYQIAANLGVTELKLGEHRDAAEHLTWYLREAPATKMEERQRAEGLLKEALAKVASVKVSVTPEGAEVKVDGASIGRAPLAQPVFLEPGAHEVSAVLEGYQPAKQSLEAKAGGTETVALRLERPPAVAPVKVVLPDAGTGEPRPSGTRTALLVSGGMAASLGVVGGVVFTVLANNKASEGDDLWKVVDDLGKDIVCSTEVTYRKQCQALRDAREQEALFANVAFWSFVGAGVVGVGTLVYGLTTQPSSAPDRRALQVTPVAGPSSAGISLRGSF